MEQRVLENQDKLTHVQVRLQLASGSQAGRVGTFPTGHHRQRPARVPASFHCEETDKYIAKSTQRRQQEQSEMDELAYSLMLIGWG